MTLSTQRLSRSSSHLDEDPFDRQRRIGKWNQRSIEEAKVMVLGAGAIGNETIKNMLLVGFRRLLICDFDDIEISNLSRTVLFRRDDVGQPKARIAAERSRALALASNPQIEWFHGDVVWDLGLHVLSDVDLIVGCLDNVEARRAINIASRKLRVPFIDAGIRELDATVAIFGGDDGEACYECGLSSQLIMESRQRYSCDSAKRAFVQATRVPTVQISAAMAGAIQCQEAVRLLAGDRSMVGSRLIWHGASNAFRRVQLTPSQSCLAHVELPGVTVAPFSATNRLDEFLHGAEELFGVGPVAIDLSGERTFVDRATCRTCGLEADVRRPLFHVTDKELECLEPSSPGCKARKPKAAQVQDGGGLTLRSRFSLAETPGLLSYTLAQLGVPKAHIVTVSLPDGTERCVALDRDRALATFSVEVDRSAKGA